MLRQIYVAWAIVSFWFKYYFKLDRAIYSREATDFIEAPGPFTSKPIHANREVIESYNEEYLELRAWIRKQKIGTASANSLYFFGVCRLGAAACILLGYWKLALVLYFGPHLLMPLSVVGAIAFAGVTISAQVPHFMLVILMQIYLLPLLPEFLRLEFQMTYLLCGIILLVDFLLCLNSYFKIKHPDSFLKQLFVGYLNSKVGIIIILAAMCGNTFSILPLLLQAFLVTAVSLQFDSLTWLFPPVAVSFYHGHRINHLPGVYGQSHKMHHILKGVLVLAPVFAYWSWSFSDNADGSPFDAQAVGFALPEATVYNAVDVLAAFCGIWPVSFGFGYIMLTLMDKSVHARNKSTNEIHVNHHLNPKVNFGPLIFGLIDCVLNTYYPKNHVATADGTIWRIERSPTESEIVVSFVKEEKVPPESQTRKKL